MTLQTSFSPNQPALIEFLSDRLNVGSMRPHAGLHVNACTTNCVIHEFNQARKYADWEEDLYGGVHIEYADGYAMLPPGPGLGIDIDEEVANLLRCAGRHVPG